MKHAIVFALLAVLSSGSALGHGDLHERIEKLSAQIEKEPRKAELFLQRGGLHHEHQEWDAAQADYEQAQVLNPQLDVIDFARGKLFLDASWPLSAKISLDRFLARHSNNVEALATRAQVLVKLGQRLAAVQDYSAAIAHSSPPKPELYLERAQALTTEGPAYYEAALKGLEEGIQKCGPLITLQLYALDVELKQKRYDAALTRLEKVTAQYPRQETWLARRGEILQQAGRPKEAAQAYEASLSAMTKLPAARRNVPAMLELEKRVRAALVAVKSEKAEGLGK